jgi:aminopeptidase YwaD
MTSDRLYSKSLNFLNIFCREITERCVGSEGNRQATYFFEKELSALGWKTSMPEFDAMDWEEKGAVLRAGDINFNVHVSPYTLGFKGEAELVSASSIVELENIDGNGKFILLKGEIAKEQLMPKNFVFYNPEEHQRIITLLENSGASAIISATGRNSALAGGVYPFPLIEDGDFNIPSVYLTEEEGEKLSLYNGKILYLESHSERIPGKGFNVIGRKGKDYSGKIVVTAHIDAKKGTQGAIDNATGVIVLLLLADLLKDYEGDKMIEIVAFNGEDYYAVPGQMNYIAANQSSFSQILLNINIDGAGYKEGPSVFSLFSLPDHLNSTVNKIFLRYPGIYEGVQWPQGDHSIFLQFGVPAIAVSSKWFIDNINDQDITHTPKDNIEIVDCSKLVEISKALAMFIRRI